MDWLANGIPPWLAYCAFMLGRLMALDKKPGVHPVGVGETWRRLFSKIVLKFTGLEVTMACQDYQICVILKEGIYGLVHKGSIYLA